MGSWSSGEQGPRNALVGCAFLAVLLLLFAVLVYVVAAPGLSGKAQAIAPASCPWPHVRVLPREPGQTPAACIGVCCFPKSHFSLAESAEMEARCLEPR